MGNFRAPGQYIDLKCWPKFQPCFLKLVFGENYFAYVYELGIIFMKFSI